MDTTGYNPTLLLPVSEMAEELKGSEIIKLADEIRKRKALGEKVYNYTIGDFNPEIFPSPEQLKEEIIRAYKEGETNYPPANGTKNLREAVSRYLHTRGGLEYNADQILIAGGARPLIYAAYKTILNPNEGVIFPVPSWNNNHYTHLNYGKPIPIETAAFDNFMPSVESIKNHISKAGLITLCSPLNPTGTMFSPKQLSDICEVILDENRKRGELKKPVYLLFDQVYWQLTFGNNLHIDPVSLYPEMKNYTIFIDGISKAFSSTGIRVGWAFGPAKIINKMKAILGHIGAWAPKAEQVATAHFLNNDTAVDKHIAWINNELESRLASFYKGFSILKNQGYPVNCIEPQGAMYLTVQINLIGKKTAENKSLSSVADISNYLLDEAKIALVPFTAFGANESSTWFRLSVGTCTKEEIPLFFQTLKKALDLLS